MRTDVRDVHVRPFAIVLDASEALWAEIFGLYAVDVVLGESVPQKRAVKLVRVHDVAN